MSKILVDTIDTRSGTSNITIGSSNASQITLKSGATLTNFPVNTPAFLASRSGNYNVSNDTTTTVPYNQEHFDTDSAYDTSTYTFTVPSGKGGKYFLQMNARSGNLANEKKLLGYLIINGSELDRAGFQTASSTGSEQYSVTVSGVYSLSAGATVKGAVIHQDGGTINFGSFGCWISGFRIIGA